MFLVKFEPLLQLLSLLGLLSSELEFLTEPLQHFLPLGSMQAVEFEPRGEHFAVGRSCNGLICRIAFIIDCLLEEGVGGCLFLIKSRLVSG
jgi:hypothetical protein